MKITINETSLTRQELNEVLDNLNQIKPNVIEVSLSNITITDLYRRPYSTESYSLDFELAKQTILETLPVELKANSKPVFQEDYTVDVLEDDYDG